MNKQACSAVPYILLLLWSTVNCVDDCGRTPISPNLSANRIVGGRPARPYSFPWMVSVCLRLAGEPECRHRCGGAIIDRTHVLSASHCYDGFFNYNSFRVKAGVFLRQTESTTQEASFQLVAVETIDLHQAYTYPFFRSNDIAVITLKTALNYTDQVQPICLPKDDTSVYVEGGKAIVTGWGVTSEGGDNSAKLQQVGVPFVGLSRCNASNNNVVDVNSQLCAGSEGRDACQADSGGPLVARSNKTGRWYQYGIVSFGKGCGRPGKPGVYSRVSKECWWINGIVGTNVCIY